jgi:hypothetical protein
VISRSCAFRISTKRERDLHAVGEPGHHSIAIEGNQLEPGRREVIDQ